jgi:hypothetical protein
MTLPALLELRDEALNPSPNSSMRDIDTELGHYIDQVSIAEFVSEIPADTDNDTCAIKVATSKQGQYMRKRRLIHDNDYQPNLAFAPEPNQRGRASAEDQERAVRHIGGDSERRGESIAGLRCSAGRITSGM